MTRPIDPEAMLARFYPPGSPLFDLLVRHGRQVAARALAAAERVAERRPDRAFIYEAAVLHDVGIGSTDNPAIGCRGTAPYVCHGVIGREMLEAAGLPRHARVCERHVGVGLTAADIRRQGLPLPARDMRPVTLEETLICYADKFFSKNGGGDSRERTVDEALALLARYGPEPADRFRAWAERFEVS